MKISDGVAFHTIRTGREQDRGFDRAAMDAVLQFVVRKQSVRCAETMCFSQATPSALRVSAAWRMVSQSDWLPMIMAIGAVIRSILFENPET